ncbi:MAG: hypothetical protein B6D59_00855 [Campylobacteraceae bacterium 4484_4]|nr:MAG: hypothetical protein B6D59_00855 [Campylobacteraceae bacterium 4484_4]
MEELFGIYGRETVFVHVLSGVIWVGGMIAIRFAVHPSLQSLEDPKIKLEKTLEIVGRLFHLVLPFILLLLVTAVVMGFGLLQSDLAGTLYLKGAIWTVMILNYGYMYFRRYRAQKLFDAGDFAAAKAEVKYLPNLLLPVNIVLGVVAIFAGVVLRGI